MNNKPYHHGNLRETLITAAHATLATEGVAGLSLRKVAQRAEVSATALYSHFADKRALLALLATQGFASLSVAMIEAASPPRAANTGEHWCLTGLARGYVTFAVENRALFDLMFGRELGDLRDFPELFEAGSRCYGVMAESVATQVASDTGEHSAAIAATAAWSMVHGLATLLNDGRVSADSCAVASTDELISQICATLSFAEDNADPA